MLSNALIWIGAILLAAGVIWGLHFAILAMIDHKAWGTLLAFLGFLLILFGVGIRWFLEE